MSYLFQKLIQLCDNSSTQLISSLGFYSEIAEDSITIQWFVITTIKHSMNFTASFYAIKNYFP